MSYLALDLDNMKVLFKASNVKSACLLSALDFENVTTAILPIERDSVYYQTGKPRSAKMPGFLTRMEQEMLYKNLANGAAVPNTVGDLGHELYKLLADLPDDAPSLFELEKRAGLDPLPADVGMPDPTVPRRLAIPPAPSSAAPTPSIPAIPRAPGIPMAPSIPKAPSAIPMAPKAGGTTARVWDIAASQLGMVDLSKIDLKVFRKSVIEECEAEGINPGTAATQFSAWKRSKGL